MLRAWRQLAKLSSKSQKLKMPPPRIQCRGLLPFHLPSKYKNNQPQEKYKYRNTGKLPFFEANSAAAH